MLEKANLSGADFSAALLPQANLAGANLSSSNLSGADLSRADLAGDELTGATLSGAKLVGADVSRANLSGANIAGADLSGAQAFQVSSGNLTGVPTGLPKGFSLVEGYLVGPGADLAQASLTGGDLAEANLLGADLSGANLSGASLLGTKLAGAELTNVVSGAITGTPASLPSSWSFVDGYLVGPGADLSGADFTDESLFGLDLQGVDLARAVLDGASSGDITGTPSALPAQWVLENGYLLGPTANLSGASLSGLDLQGIDLAGATLTNVASGGVSGTPSSLPTGWFVLSGYLLGPGADLIDADLAGVDLSQASLGGADLAGANLAGADLSQASLGGADLAGAVLSAANMTSAELSAANLSEADLSGVNAANADFDRGEPPNNQPRRCRPLWGEPLGRRDGRGGHRGHEPRSGDTRRARLGQSRRRSDPPDRLLAHDYRLGHRDNWTGNRDGELVDVPTSARIDCHEPRCHQGAPLSICWR